MCDTIAILRCFLLGGRAELVERAAELFGAPDVAEPAAARP